MENILHYFGPWSWFIIAGALFLLELAMPGVFFIWLGIAAVATGLIDLVLPMSWQVELVVFAALSIVFLVVGRPMAMKRVSLETDQPNLNNRNQDFIGKRHKLTEAINAGRGTLTINDTRWRIRGKDCPKGSWVKVVAIDGMELVVEADGE